MKRICLVSPRANSLKNIMYDIESVVLKGKKQFLEITGYESNQQLSEKCEEVVYINALTPTWTRHVIVNLLKLVQMKPKVPSLFYFTLDGDLIKEMTPDWYLDYDNYIANSIASKERAERAGLTVRDVVYHAVIPEQIESILHLKNNFRDFLKSQFGDRIIFGVNESNLARKGWELFMKAWAKASEQTDKILLYALTNYNLTDYVSTYRNIYVDPSYGKMSRIEVLQKMNAVDVGIVPSLAEGFGMPLLEFNALGKPVIHGDFAPLNEISIVDNYKLKVVNFMKYKMESTRTDGIDYTFMLYDVDEMAKTIVNIAENGYREIDNEKVLEKFDANKLYMNLLNYAV